MLHGSVGVTRSDEMGCPAFRRAMTTNSRLAEPARRCVCQSGAVRVTPSIPRYISLLLAISGAVWAVLLVLLAAETGWTFVLLHFGLGFVVWAGWIARAVLPLGLALRCAIWVASIGVNGWWLRQMLVSRAGEPWPHSAWWAAAVVLSAVALAFERR
jgi:hypothetical protein